MKERPLEKNSRKYGIISKCAEDILTDLYMSVYGLKKISSVPSSWIKAHQQRVESILISTLIKMRDISDDEISEDSKRSVITDKKDSISGRKNTERNQLHLFE